MRKFFLTLVAVTFFAGVFAPLVSLFMRITPEGLARVMSSPQFFAALFNSLSTGLVATVLAMALALAAA